MTFSKSRLAVAVMAVTTGFVHAEQTPSVPVTLMDQVTVTATRSEKQLKDVAASVSVIDEEQMEKKLVTDIKDLVRYEPGVTVGTNSRGGLDDFNIRGMDGNRVKIMVDGVDMPQQFDTGYYYQQPQRSQIDVDTLKAVEIVKGPSSSLYGGGAIGGIVAFQTKDPADYLNSKGDDTAASVKATYTSADEGFAETMTLANRTGDLESLLVYTRRDQKEAETYEGADSLGATRGQADPSDSDSNNFLGKLQYQINNANRVGLTAEYVEDKIDTVFKSESSEGQDPVTGEDDMTRKRVGVFHEWDANTVAFDKMRWQLDWQDSSTRHITAKSSEEVKDYSYGEESLKLAAQFDKALSSGNMQHEVVYGFDVNKVETSNKNTTYKNDNPKDYTYIPKVDDLNYGLFVQDQIQVNNRLTVTPGFRFDSYDYTAEGVLGSGEEAPDSSGSKLTGQLGAVYQLTEDLSLFGQFSQGFKAPGLFDMYYAADEGRGYKIEANPDLKPEESDSWEFGLRGSNDLGSFEVTGFFNQYKNFIETVTSIEQGYPFGVFRTENIEEAEIKGIELRGQLWLDEAVNAPAGTSLRGSVAYADGKNKTTDEALSSIAPLTAVVGLGYDDMSGNWGGELAWTLVKGKDDADVSEGDYNPAGYGLVDLTAYYMPVEELTLRAGLFNITDKKYYQWDDVRGVSETDEGLDRYSEPGRNFSVSARYEF